MALVDKATLCDLIPHAGSMCLLDEVLAWDEDQIQCRSQSHLLQDNPLRSAGGLNSIMLLEYGAQAMAVHGGLLARAKGERINEGYLAALRDIKIEDAQIDTIKSPLLVEASKMMAQQGNMIYQFSVKVDDKVLVSGRATVISN